LFDSVNQGEIVEMEATLKNVGRLPSKIEPGFEPGGGKLTVYVRSPDGTLKVRCKIKGLLIYFCGRKFVVSYSENLSNTTLINLWP